MEQNLIDSSPKTFSLKNIAPAIGVCVVIFCAILPIIMTLSGRFSFSILIADLILLVVNMFIGGVVSKSKKTMGMLIIVFSIAIFLVILFAGYMFLALSGLSGR